MSSKPCLPTLAIIACLIATSQRATLAADPAPQVLGEVPAFQLSDQTGRVFNREITRDNVWIANFIFTREDSTTPMQMARMAALGTSFKERNDLLLVSFSVDPEHDTAPVLQTYAKRYSAEAERWKLVTGTREALWSLSKQGFKLDVGKAAKPLAMPIQHSSQLVLVDRANRIRGYYDGVSDDGLAKLKTDLSAVLSESHSPTSFKPFPFPSFVANPQWVKNRAARQIAAKETQGVFNNFGFTDHSPSSGITFEHISVEDASKSNVAAHYDHGNSVALADVDGDGLLDIYWTTQIGSNALWRDAGGGKFEDITSPALTLADRVCIGASFADTDNDGDPDLVVTSVRGENAFLRNDGEGRFTDFTKESGLSYQGHSSAAVVFDYNRDGLVDVFICNIGTYTNERERGPGGYYKAIDDAFAGHLKPERHERSLLYENKGGNRFVEVSNAVGLVDLSWTGAASPVDFNRDGWQDLYVLNMQGHDEYYENVKGKRFRKRSREYFPKTSWGAMGIKSFDYNNDGLLDLYVTDMHSDMSHTIKLGEESLKSRMTWPESLLRSGGQSIFGNTFYHNNGKGFIEISDRLNLENYWPWGVSVGDLNADGFEDVFVTCSMNYPFAYSVNKTYLNVQGQRFADSEFILGVEPRRGGRTAKPIFKLDPNQDDKDHQMVAIHDLTEPVEIWGALGSRSSAIADLDNDGDLDIVTNEFNDGPMLLLSNLSERKPDLNWLKVELVGKTSNASCLGAMVQVRAGEQAFTRVRDGQSGYLSQSLAPLYFGLGQSGQADRLTVMWPSGKSQIVEGPILANRVLTITEPSEGE